MHPLGLCLHCEMKPFSVEISEFVVKTGYYECNWAKYVEFILILAVWLDIVILPTYPILPRVLENLDLGIQR